MENEKSVVSYQTGMDKYFIHFILPGKYRLRKGITDYVTMKKGFFSDKIVPTNFHSTHYGLDSGEITFEARPNDVVYLGDFIFVDLYPSRMKNSFLLEQSRRGFS